MTLKEYVEQLPSGHAARIEFDLIAESVTRLARLVLIASVHDLAEIIEIDEDGNVTPLGAKVLRDPGPMDRPSSTRDAQENSPDSEARNP